MCGKGKMENLPAGSWKTQSFLVNRINYMRVRNSRNNREIFAQFTISDERIYAFICNIDTTSNPTFVAMSNAVEVITPPDTVIQSPYRMATPQSVSFWCTAFDKFCYFQSVCGKFQVLVWRVKFDTICAVCSFNFSMSDKKFSIAIQNWRKNWINRYLKWVTNIFHKSSNWTIECVFNFKYGNGLKRLGIVLLR